jgi:hypothetical protein
VLLVRTEAVVARVGEEESVGGWVRVRVRGERVVGRGCESLRIGRVGGGRVRRRRLEGRFSDETSRGERRVRETRGKIVDGVGFERGNGGEVAGGEVDGGSDC